MAKLVTTKEKYGVSVAARIAPELAYEIADRAERVGVSMAKMLSMIITKGMSQTESDSHTYAELKRLKTEVDTHDDEMEKLQDFYRNVAGELIAKMTSSNEERLQYIEVYNDLLIEMAYDEQ